MKIPSFNNRYLLNITAVNRKSSASTVRELITTVWVVAWATPSGVGLASQPWYNAMKVTATPNTMLLITPLAVPITGAECHIYAARKMTILMNFFLRATLNKPSFFRWH
jgi:hypothetical protein